MTQVLSPIDAISPLDGRYANKTSSLNQYFSEKALIKYRTIVEVKWFLFLSDLDAFTALPTLDKATKDQLDDVITQFSDEDANRVKAFEAECNHDVKSVEYFLREKCEALLGDKIEFFHFGCTSEDINNLAYSLMVRDACHNELTTNLNSLKAKLVSLAKEHADTPMLCRTHGQPASPSTLGKEFANFAYRISSASQILKMIPMRGKFNGATGNFNAHAVSYPNIDWIKTAATFVDSLSLAFNFFTTQIEPHDTLAAHFDCIKRINNILLDLSQDCWQYISLDYLKLKTVAKEVGSSTMPHKVNPINFENAEGNFGLANAMLTHLSEKLMRSRLQRDLSDSTVLRNVGVAYGYSLLAYKALEKGLNQITANTEKLAEDLDQHWEVLAEPIQMVLRQHQVKNGYELLKEFSRGQKIEKDNIAELIASLPIPEESKQALLELTPANYTGLATKLVEENLDKLQD